MMIQQNSNGQRRNYYRPFQYRSVSLDINPNKLRISKDKLSGIQYRKVQTTKNEQRKNKRNLLFRSQQNKFNKTLSQSLSKTKELQLHSTIITKGNPEDQAVTNFGTCTYIQSFQQLMQIQANRSNQPKRISAKSIKLQSIKNSSKIDRIILPSIIQYENTQFTALDPIRLPINSIKEDIQKTRKQVQECPSRLNSIRWEMKDFKNKKIQDLQKFQSQCMKGIDRLWGKIRQNVIFHQGFVLRSKRQIKELVQFLPPFKNQIEVAHSNQLKLQIDIFQTSPFQLKINTSENEASIQKGSTQIQSKSGISYF